MIRKILVFLALCALLGVAVLCFRLCFSEKRSQSAVAASPLDIVINISPDERNVSISVFNIRANNIRVNSSYRQAEALGDLEVRFIGKGGAYHSRAPKYFDPGEYLVDWLPRGNGIGWSLPKEFFVGRYQLPQGCYTMEVSFSNRAAMRASVTGHPGPISPPAVAKHAICF